MQTRFRLFVLVGAGLLTAGCSSGLKVSSVPIAPREPVAEAREVRILRDQAPVAYTEVAHIELRWAGLRSEAQVVRNERIREALQAEAARLGADALIGLRFISEPAGHRPDRWVPEPRRLTGVSATAVRLKSRA